jgi:hypothetical protein
MKRLKIKLIQVCTLLLTLCMATAVRATGNQTSTYPPNDLCTDATEIGDVKNLQFYTTGARFGGEGLCMTSPNIWYYYTAPATGDVTISLAGSGYDTMLAVYKEAECFPTSNDLITCNDDFGGTYQSQVTFPAIAGGRYLIEVGGYGNQTGSGLISIESEGQPSPPPHKDDCSNAEPVGDVTDMPFETSSAAFDGPGLCMTSPNTWFLYTAPSTGNATVSLLGSGFDTMLAVYDSAQCDLSVADLIECNDDAAGTYQSQITFAATAGSQYLIEVGGYGNGTGNGVLNIKSQGIVVEAKSDLGDAPDKTNNSTSGMRAYAQPWVGAWYPTVYDDGSGNGPVGPVHLNDEMVAYLGSAITAEEEADIGPDEDGVNNINPTGNSPDHDGGDDGVEVPLTLPDNGWASFDFKVTVVESGTPLWVNVWLDFNRDGDWDDIVDSPAGPVNEWAVQNQYLFNLPEGESTITTPGFLCVNLDDAHEEIWMRITLAGQPWTGGSNPNRRGHGGSGPQEKYQIGETEDYFFTPEMPGSEECPLCEDVNGDGVIDIQDLVVHITQWLATCQ